MLGFPVPHVFYGVIDSTPTSAKQASTRKGTIHKSFHQSIVSIGLRKFLPEIFARTGQGSWPAFFSRLRFFTHNLIITKTNNKLCN
jgi:hypothetical protein